MENFEKREFTETAVLFALTGHVFTRADASLEYYQRCLHEIHEDELYKYIMNSVPESILKNLWEEMGSEVQDVDPIIAKYLCREHPELVAIKEYSDGTPYPKSQNYIEENFLKNGYINVTPIDFQSFCEYAREFTETKDSENIVK